MLSLYETKSRISDHFLGVAGIYAVSAEENQIKIHTNDGQTDEFQATFAKIKQTAKPYETVFQQGDPPILA